MLDVRVESFVSITVLTTLSSFRGDDPVDIAPVVFPDGFLNFPLNIPIFVDIVSGGISSLLPVQSLTFLDQPFDRA